MFLGIECGYKNSFREWGLSGRGVSYIIVSGNGDRVWVRIGSGDRM